MGEGKLIDEAVDLLRSFDVDEGRMNERSAMTLLALLQLKQGDSWKDATNPMLGTRAIMDWIRDEFGVEYKPNTRETIRRSTLHQFVIAGIVEENADEPDRSQNSLKWDYRVTDDALKAIRNYGGTNFESDIEAFLSEHESYRSLAEERRNMPKTPVTVPPGVDVRLSSKGQSLLIKAMAEEMLPRFAPGSQVLHIDDTDHQHGAVDVAMMDELGISLPACGEGSGCDRVGCRPRMVVPAGGHQHARSRGRDSKGGAAEACSRTNEARWYGSPVSRTARLCNAT